MRSYSLIACLVVLAACRDRATAPEECPDTLVGRDAVAQTTATDRDTASSEGRATIPLILDISDPCHYQTTGTTTTTTSGTERPVDPPPDWDSAVVTPIIPRPR